MTLPKVLVWSLTVILCRQQGMGRQLVARGLDISRTIGVSSSSVRVRVKGRLEEQFETEVIIKEVVVVCLEEQSQSQHQQLQSQRPRQGFLAHLVVEVINKNLVRSSLLTRRSPPLRGEADDQSWPPSPHNHSQSPPLGYSGIFAVI